MIILTLFGHLYPENKISIMQCWVVQYPFHVLFFLRLVQK